MKKEIVVFEKKNEWDLPENLNDFLKYWTDKFGQIPDKFRSDACVEVEATPGYPNDPPEISIKISYLRPETDEEKYNRMRRKDDRVEALKQYELRELERLSKKYN